MKNKINQILCMAAMSATVLTSCQTDFADINRDHRQPTEDELKMDNLNVGGFATAFEMSIFPVGSSGTGYVNDYQIPYTLGGACWIGYMAPPQNKWVGRGFPTFTLKPWSQYTYNVMAGNAYRNWLDMKKRTADDPAGFAVAQIIKVAAVHKATDTFGPIPYSKAGIEGTALAEYDSQEDVYKAMLKELDESVQTLAKEAHDVFPKYDVIYEGDYVKWCKLANSLMLRLAMRVVYANEALAKQYAEKAITNPHGVFEAMGDGATLCKGAGVVLKNPLVIINDAGYNDARMGAEIASYMKGYKDPRLASYFQKGTVKNVSDYYGLRTNMPSTTDYLDRDKISLLKVEDGTPVYIMKTSEVYFLRAEGALRGWNMGGANSAKTFYEQGIATSFEENGLGTDKAATYAADATAKPVNFVDPINSQYSADAPSDITIKWQDGDFEKSLERIITQKYLAIYPDGQEAWSEFRRTGYPRIFKAVSVSTDCDVNGDNRPTRIPYSNDEYTKNLDNITKAVKLLGGPDNGATRVWWDKKSNK
uniref:RagB/SusD family nutrient uptake outer membrane protein n=1 Tax=Prevotella sp. GTC17253 TaxID=3236793 RepID=A0AB33IUW4_9BACT